MASELPEETRAKLREVVVFIQHLDVEAGERLLTEALNMFVDQQESATIFREAWIRFKLTCRGCGKEVFNHTEKTPVAAGKGAPTLTLSTALDPHTCERKAAGLFRGM